MYNKGKVQVYVVFVLILSFE